MEVVIFQTVTAVFIFSPKEVKEHLIHDHSLYYSAELARLLKIISSDTNKTILNSYDHHYFGYVVLDLISEGIGIASCKICSKIYDSGQLTSIEAGNGKSPFDINPEQKGGSRLFGKKKNPSMFGGKGIICPENHRLISMEIWRT